MHIYINRNENSEKYKCFLLSEAGEQLMGAAKRGTQAKEDFRF